MADRATAYDRVSYPSGAFRETHPDMLAAIARMHGLSPPSVTTARVLDIGGGDGSNLLAVAETLPDAHFLNVDLAETAIARGRALAAASGQSNVRMAVADITELAETLEGPFDYVIAHGVYAWVPAPVRDALMALIGRVLSPTGVAYLSYNALPGGHYRRIIREMLLHELEGIDEPAARIAAARAFAARYATPDPKDESLAALLRQSIGLFEKRHDGSLLHDELGEVFEPQRFSDVIAAAAGHGLAFLNDADSGSWEEGFADGAADEAAVIRAAQGRQNEKVAFFRRTLLVRAGQRPARGLPRATLRDLQMSAPCERTGDGGFVWQGTKVSIPDAKLTAALEAAVDAYPGRLRVGDLVDDDLRLGAVYRLAVADLVRLHTIPFAGAAAPGARPCTSRIARALLAGGQEALPTLDMDTVSFATPDSRAFVAMLDGTRDRTALAAAWAAGPFAETVTFEAGLARLAKGAMLIA